MKHLRTQIKALLVIGEDPNRFVYEALNRITIGEGNVRDMKLWDAIRDDVQAFTSALVTTEQVKGTVPTKSAQA